MKFILSGLIHVEHIQIYTDFVGIDCPGWRKILNNYEIRLKKEVKDMTYSLDIDFMKPPKNLPGPIFAHIYVKNYCKDHQGLIFITPDCVTIGELEYEISRLQKELENIRNKARKRFVKIKEKVQN